MGMRNEGPSVVGISSEPILVRLGRKIFSGARAAETHGPPETFRYEPARRLLTRKLSLGRWEGVSSVAVELAGRSRTPSQPVLASAYDYAWLRASVRPVPRTSGRAIRVVDLFAGFGGMTLGLEELARALGRDFELVWAADIDEPARRTVLHNYRPSRRPFRHPIERLIDGGLGDWNGRPPTLELTPRESVLRKALGSDRTTHGIDFLVGGPPCQGHSDFNNHTRWSDPKNQLYARMARAALVLNPRHVIIENVPGVQRDSTGVLESTIGYLRAIGYEVDEGVLPSEDLGVAQSRHRRFVLATRVGATPSVEDLLATWRVPRRPVEWAIEGLPVDEGGQGFDAPARRLARTQARIDYLFEHDVFRLPDSERPECHRNKAHNYTSIYGRMWKNRPASTLTTGFMVMGQGRFVHPHEPRTLTPHEGARIQFVPDWFDFPVDRRKDYGRLIGNAVPSKVAYVAGAYLLGLE